MSSYRHFYVGDNSHLEVAAFDDEGNIFTGSNFIKSIPRPEGYSHHGKNGTDIFYAKGLKEGNAVVKVEILEPGYENIAAVNISVSIVEPFITEP
jgi:hypothetical protein